MQKFIILKWVGPTTPGCGGNWGILCPNAEDVIIFGTHKKAKNFLEQWLSDALDCELPHWKKYYKILGIKWPKNDFEGIPLHEPDI